MGETPGSPPGSGHGRRPPPVAVGPCPARSPGGLRRSRRRRAPDEAQSGVGRTAASVHRTRRLWTRCERLRVSPNARTYQRGTCHRSAGAGEAAKLPRSCIPEGELVAGRCWGYPACRLRPDSAIVGGSPRGASRQPSALMAAPSMAASMLPKFVLSILSITGPVSRPIGPPLGTYR